MEININKLIEKLPDIKKASSLSSKKTHKASSHYTLGDKRRFEKLPSKVNSEFIKMYREDLDNFLIPYIQHGELTVTKAHSFIENLVTQVFGDYHHYGIFSYLKERNYENEPENELVRSAERLINSGWRIRKDTNTSRYKLYNSEGSLVIDVTGKSDLYEEAEALSLDEKSAHLFIDGSVASKIESLAKKVGMSADDLAYMDSLEVLLIHTQDREIIGNIENYKKLKTVLKKLASYKTFTKGTTFTELYSQGYAVDGSMVKSSLNPAVLSKGKNKYLLYPVSPEVNKIYSVNKDLISAISSSLKNSLFNNITNVFSQELIEIKELERVFALMVDYVDNDLTNMSYSDMVDFVSRLDSYLSNGEIKKSFYNKILQGVSQIVVTESILLGNRWFSFSGFNLDTVSGKSHVYSNRDAFTEKISTLTSFIDSYNENKTKSKDSLSIFTKSIYPFRMDDDNFIKNSNIFIDNLPSEYFTALASLDFNFEGYGLDFTGIVEYLEKAREFLMIGSGE